MSPKVLHLRGFMSDTKDDFAKWLALELAPTIFGNKPATVLSLANTSSMPLFSMWQKYGQSVVEGSAVKKFTLRETAKSLTILFYHPESLTKCMEESSHKIFLHRCGYRPDAGLEQCLELLRKRYQHTCPHEIGLLLGIPLKDVLGFMGLSHLPLTCKGMWKIYGEPECSLSAMRCFLEDRRRVEEQLNLGKAPQQVLCG